MLFITLLVQLIAKVSNTAYSCAEICCARKAQRALKQSECFTAKVAGVTAQKQSRKVCLLPSI